MATTELPTNRRIVVDSDKAPASLDPKVTEHPHLQRGQAIARSVLAGIPDLTHILAYEDPQAAAVKRSFGLVGGMPSADTSDGLVYRASIGNDRSLARIRYQVGVYAFTGEGPTKLNDLAMRSERGMLTADQYAEQRRMAEPLGSGTAMFP